jgi:hypothetical protein
MFEGLGDAPHEASAAERTTASTGPDDGGTDDGGTDDGGTDDGGDDADDGGPPSPRQG